MELEVAVKQAPIRRIHRPIKTPQQCNATSASIRLRIGRQAVYRIAGCQEPQSQVQKASKYAFSLLPVAIHDFIEAMFW
jgi:hypothetical protein